MLPFKHHPLRAHCGPTLSASVEEFGAGFWGQASLSLYFLYLPKQQAAHAVAM